MTLRRPAALLFGAWLMTLALASVSAQADAPSKAGWWNAASLGGVVAPMPTTAAGDLHVGQGPQGPTAYAAVAYDLAGQPGSTAVLELKVTRNSTVGTPDLTACLTKSATWKAADNGPVADGPAFDCSANSVSGLISADGNTVTFLLGEAQQKAGGFSLAIVPAAQSLPFQVDLTKAGTQSLTLSDAGAAFEPTTPAGPAADVDVSPALPSEVPHSGVGAPLNVDIPPLPGAPTMAQPAPEPALAAPATAQPLAVPAAVASLLPPLDNRQRYLAGILLALIVGALIWAMQNQSPEPRLIGGLARALPAVPLTARPGAVTGGIGRFAVLRTGPPRRLR